MRKRSVFLPCIHILKAQKDMIFETNTDEGVAGIRKHTTSAKVTERQILPDRPSRRQRMKDPCRPIVQCDLVRRLGCTSSRALDVPRDAERGPPVEMSDSAGPTNLQNERKGQKISKKRMKQGCDIPSCARSTRGFDTYRATCAVTEGSAFRRTKSQAQ